jgi:hypothetical protein
MDPSRIKLWETNYCAMCHCMHVGAPSCSVHPHPSIWHCMHVGASSCSIHPHPSIFLSLRLEGGSATSLSLCIVCQGRVINLASPAGSRSEVRGPGAESDGRRNKILVQARKGHSYGYLSLEFTDQMTLL